MERLENTYLLVLMLALMIASIKLGCNIGMKMESEESMQCYYDLKPSNFDCKFYKKLDYAVVYNYLDHKDGELQASTTEGIYWFKHYDELNEFLIDLCLYQEEFDSKYLKDWQRYREKQILFKDERYTD